MAFRGWKVEALEFFEGLEADNSKAYWQRNKSVYEALVRAPMEELLAELAPEWGEGKIFRPYRDIRFSSDKSPYKTNLYADVREGGYIALDAHGLIAAGGRYMIDTPQLARFREAIAADGSGGELEGIVSALRKKGYEIGGEELKRVPPPYPQDHPRGRLLRHKRLIYWRRWESALWIATPQARERVAAVWRDGAALNAWMARHVVAAGGA